MKKVLEMITVFRRLFMNENEVIEVDHIDHDNYEEYIGKTVKVKGNVDLNDLGLTKIPINFTEVGGHFDCSWNQLTSLVGAPKEVGDGFYCSHNKLTSLVGSPKEVGYDFDCSWNQLTSLVSAPNVVMCGNFVCWGNSLESTKGKPMYIRGEFKKTYSDEEEISVFLQIILIISLSVFIICCIIIIILAISSFISWIIS